ncbi:MAG: GspH/FimT family protein [Pseudomonadota bacterium]
MNSISPTRRHVRGFTLFELLIVLVLLALALGIVVPSLGGGSATELRSAAADLSSALRKVRAEAMTRNRSVVLTLDVERKAIRIGDTPSERRLPQGVEYELFTADTERTGDTSGRVRFFPNGSSTGGRVTVSVGERSLLVDIDWFTGRVRVIDPDALDDA